jgi:hypothetical protein
MKRKRGRPRGKTYPEPDTISKALDTAMYGKIGASEAMALLRDSPFPTLDYIKGKPPKKRNAVDKEYLRRAPEFIERWSRRAGQILCDKVALRDVKFFRDLADALEELSKETQKAFAGTLLSNTSSFVKPTMCLLLPRDSAITTSVAIPGTRSTPARSPK